MSKYSEDMIMGYRIFVESLSDARLIEFLISQEKAIEGLTKNNDSFAKSYRDLYEKHQRKGRALRAAFDDILKKRHRRMMDLLDLIFEMFQIACKTENGYDHHCNSAYKEAQRILVSEGFIKEEECFRVSPEE